MSTSVEARRGRHAGPPEGGLAEGARSGRRRPDSGGRLGSWQSSWRIALRMARRELRRHRGRSVVVSLMVALPLVIIAYLGTTAQTALGSGGPDPARIMGTAAAVVHAPVSAQVLQDGAHDYWAPATLGELGSAETIPAEPIPGYDPDGAPAANAAAIAALTGGAATPIAEPSIRVQSGTRTVSVQTLALAGTPTLGDKARLVSGRWPTGPQEALVTAPGTRLGLAATGTVEVVTGEGTTTVTITGTATGVTSWGMIPHLITSEPLPSTPLGAQAPARWVITDTDMPYAKVADLGRFGLLVQSAELMDDPVPASQLPPEIQQMAFSDQSLLFFWITGALILALIIALLVAPAFAVSAARQRQTLALAASNGATTGQLRRTVLAQALVLGALSAVVGAAAGVSIAAGQAWWNSRTATDVRLPIVDVPWTAVVAVTLCAVAAAVTAALVPARRLGRLDIIGVLKGQSVSPAPSRVIPVVGAVVMALSAAVLLVGARRPAGGEYVVALAAIGLVAGALALVPITLVAVGRLGRVLPVSLRMAARDTARQRARSVPSVAAVMGGVAALTISLIAMTSDSREAQVTYLPQTIMGQGILRASEPADLEPAAAAVRTVAPEARLVPFATVGDFWTMPTADARIPFVVITTPGCTGEQAVYDREHAEAQQAAFDAAPDQDAFVWADAPCPTLGGPSSSTGPIVAMPADEIASRMGLSDEEAAQVRNGAVIVRDEALLPVGTAVALSGTYAAEEMTGAPIDIVTTGEVEAPLLVVPDTAESRTLMLESTAALVAREVVEGRDWPLASPAYLVGDGDGDEALTPAQASQIQDRLQNAELYVERGFVDPVRTFLMVLVGGVSFLLLVVVLTSTALSLSEQRRDDATLAAVGATRRTRRTMAAAQAFITAAVGAVLGLAVGLVPGIAFAYPLTRSFGEEGQTVGPFVTIPYAWLALVVVGVPLVAALVSALAVRRAPDVTRRAD